LQSSFSASFDEVSNKVDYIADVSIYNVIKVGKGEGKGDTGFVAEVFVVAYDDENGWTGG
jgi:hypothetical protein